MSKAYNLFYINFFYILEELPILLAGYTAISLKAGNEEDLMWNLLFLGELRGQ
jgi:hypothetical protein